MTDFTVQPNHMLMRNGDHWLYFDAPQTILCTYKAQEVQDCLQQAQAHINNGKWVCGFCSYDTQEQQFPLVWLAVGPKPRVITNQVLVQAARDSFAKGVLPPLHWQCDTSLDTYEAKWQAIQKQLQQGNTYQVNFTMRMHSQFSQNTWDFFLQKMVLPQAPYAVYLPLEDWVICSGSPELFLHKQGNTLTSEPMKGTRPVVEQEPREQVERFFSNSAKEQAENLMIVDMIRNDMGKIAQYGTVRVPQLFTVQKYSTVWQMTSTVQCETKQSFASIFEAMFPCASITGAPKRKTMQIIQEQECSDRGLYTGSLGWANSQDMLWNVAIRTVVIHTATQQAVYGVGSGVVWDSTAPSEYRECMHKTALLQADTRPVLLETMLYDAQQASIWLWEFHLQRLRQAAYHWSIPFCEQAIVKALQGFVPHGQELGSNQQDATPTDTKAGIEHAASTQNAATDVAPFTRLRVLYSPNGQVQVQATPLPVDPRVHEVPNVVALSVKPIVSDDWRLRFKTNRRELYEHAMETTVQHRQGEGLWDTLDDVLLWNENGCLTESTRANLVVQMQGAFYTPPVQDGLLGGTFRASLLQSGVISTKSLTVEQLRTASSVWLINSIRGWIPVKMV
jgi:para-aminobenzoate synthetase / 4-amino-4-deoxychorismate lyase